MDEDKKKPIMIGIIVGSLALAGAVTFMTRDSGSKGINSIPKEKMMWVICRNDKDKCEANYEIQMREYYRQIENIQRQREVMTVESPALICEKCNKESLYKAFKCQKCKLVFEGNIKRGDFGDRCPNPKCGYSDIERGRREKATARLKDAGGK